MVNSDIDQLMRRASDELARMDYLGCERTCQQALAAARLEGNFEDYARILLPLQEARRQRRLTAAEGGIRLGSASLEGEPPQWLEALGAGCIMLGHPHGAEQARALLTLAREHQLHLEVLWADSPVDDDRWTVRSFEGPDVRCEVDAPPRTWRDRWLTPGEVLGGQGEVELDPSGWFLAASETLGDAALTYGKAPRDLSSRLARLEACLQVVTDHELLHQALAETARRAARQLLSATGSSRKDEPPGGRGAPQAGQPRSQAQPKTEC